MTEIEHETQNLIFILSKPIILTIAGFDPSGGAGLQADIKTISALGSYACSVATSLTVQNTIKVYNAYSVSTSIIEEQFDKLMMDMPIRYLKIGMLANKDIVVLLSKLISKYKDNFDFIILDPIIKSSSGHFLLDKEGLKVLFTSILPKTNLITPNYIEACEIFQLSPKSSLAHNISCIQESLGDLEIPFCLLKGGHLPTSNNQCIDYLISSKTVQSFMGTKINSKNTHGTGCTLSSAIVTEISQGNCLTKSISKAKEYLIQSMLLSKKSTLGSGSGSLEHFHNLL